VKGGGVEKEEDADPAVSLPHAVAPVGAPSVYASIATAALRSIREVTGRKKRTATWLLRCRMR
jgi:hypothetical protein